MLESANRVSGFRCACATATCETWPDAQLWV